MPFGSSKSASYDDDWNRMTLYKSFKNEVLILAPPPPFLRPPIDMSKKGLSTRQATPPAVWVKKSVDGYLDRANEVVERHKKELSASYLPAPYVPCVLDSETDVVQASVLWILHPVIKALQAAFPNVKCAAEVTLGDCRCDAIFTIEGKNIALLEYKNRGYIKKAHFESARVSDPSIGNRQQIEKFIFEARRQGGESAMAHNAVCLSKQAAAYATKWQTRHVALFDWDAMFFWNFAGMSFVPPRPGSSLPMDGHADWAWGTWVDRRDEYRTALLGFVLEAYRDSRHPNFKKAATPPWEPTAAQRLRQRQENEARRLQQMTPTQRANQQLYSRRG